MYKPMLAETAREPFDNPEWVFEPKWDGVRAISYGGRLIARSGNDLTRQFPELALSADVVLDGEIVVPSSSSGHRLGPDGKPDFAAVSGRVHLQNRTIIGARMVTQPAIYFAFDILELRGQPLVRQPLVERRAVLERIMPAGGQLRLTPQVKGKGVELFSRLRELAMEGIMAKRSASLYQPGVRSWDWLKIKVSRHGEFWVVGATVREGRREGLIGALVLAEETPQGLVPVGEVGTGFSDEELLSLTRLLLGMRVEKPIVSASVAKLWFWTEPKVKVKVSYLERTADGRLRFPAYKGTEGTEP